MKIAVIGGNGYLGYYVTRYFGADSLSRQNGFDITDFCTIEEKVNEYDVVIHMAANVDKSDKDPEKVFGVNAQGTYNLVKCLKQHQTLIFTSTKEVNKYIIDNAYDYSKLIAEKYIEYYGKHLGFKYGIFRLATIYAPPVKGKTWVNKLVNKVNYDEIVELFNEGKQIRDFLYVNDLCRAFEMFLESKIGQGLYDIGGGVGNAMSIMQFVKVASEVLKREPNIQFVDMPELNQAAVPSARRGEYHYITDNRKLFLQLDWKPECSIVKGIRKIAT